MTIVEIALPDQLAADVEQAGRLSPESVEQLFRGCLKERRAQQLLEAMERMSAVNDRTPMSPEEVADEIRAMRAERRAGLAAK